MSLIMDSLWDFLVCEVKDVVVNSKEGKWGWTVGQLDT